ncbi:hypothetical protein HK099_000463, partial [Clydaea vesicula]
YFEEDHFNKFINLFYDGLNLEEENHFQKETQVKEGDSEINDPKKQQLNLPFQPQLSQQQQQPKFMNHPAQMLAPRMQNVNQSHYNQFPQSPPMGAPHMLQQQFLATQQLQQQQFFQQQQIQRQQFMQQQQFMNNAGMPPHPPHFNPSFNPALNPPMSHPVGVIPAQVPPPPPVVQEPWKLPAAIMVDLCKNQTTRKPYEPLQKKIPPPNFKPIEESVFIEFYSGLEKFKEEKKNKNLKKDNNANDEDELKNSKFYDDGFEIGYL